MPKPPYISVAAAAEMIGCSESLVKLMAADGKIGNSFKQGKRAWSIDRRSAEMIHAGRGRPKAVESDAESAV